MKKLAIRYSSVGEGVVTQIEISTADQTTFVRKAFRPEVRGQHVEWIPLGSEESWAEPRAVGEEIIDALTRGGIWDAADYDAGSGMLDGECFEISLEDPDHQKKQLYWFCPNEAKQERLGHLVDQMRSVLQLKRATGRR